MHPLPAEHLPPSVVELIDVVGLAAALAIVEERGGIKLYVPVKADPDHWLAALIGITALEAMVAYYQGDEIEVPRCAEALRAARELQIATEAAAGDSNATLARRHGYTERGIRKLRRRVEVQYDGRQDDLFRVCNTD